LDRGVFPVDIVPPGATPASTSAAGDAVVAALRQYSATPRSRHPLDTRKLSCYLGCSSSSDRLVSGSLIVLAPSLVRLAGPQRLRVLPPISITRGASRPRAAGQVSR